MDECVFCAIANGNSSCHEIWQNEEFMAFLSIFPNTQGFSVVIPKEHYPSYIFDLPDEIFTKFMFAVREVARLLDSKLEDVGRTGLILDGVDHAHAKLIPLHGTASIPKWRPIVSFKEEYYDKYPGYISSHDYARADDKDLEKIARKIRKEN
jgi:histidine triad (HIT) family protein